MKLFNLKSKEQEKLMIKLKQNKRKKTLKSKLKKNEFTI